MKNYIIRRTLQIIPVLFIITFVIFVLVRIVGDPVVLMLPENATEEEIANLKESMNLDKPIIVQYGLYLKDITQGSFGDSYRYKQDALSIVIEKLPATFELGIFAIIIAILVAVPLGIWSATKKDTFVDLFITGFSVFGKAMPNFWLSIMLILIFSVVFQFFPVSGRGSWLHLVLPGISLAAVIAPDISRITRSSMLEVLNQDYIRTAESKGLKRFAVIYKHAFRNALLPIVSIISLQVSAIIAGSIITESVFSWPGMGQLLIESIIERDMPVVQAAVLLISVFVIIINLITDIVYSLIDPRIKYG